MEDLQLKTHITKDLSDLFKVLGVDGKVLVVDDENRNLYLGSRNLAKTKMVSTSGINVYDLLNCDHLIISRKSVEKLEETLRP